IEIKGSSQVTGYVEADVSGGSGWAEALAYGKGQVAYADQTVLAETKEGLALTTPSTPYTVGGGVQIVGNGVQVTTTWVADQPAKLEKPLADLDNGVYREADFAAVTILAKGYAYLWLESGATGTVEYNSTVVVT